MSPFSILPSTPYMGLPIEFFIRFCCVTATSCCAITAAVPSNKAPTTKAVRIIRQFLAFQDPVDNPYCNTVATASFPKATRPSQAVMALMLLDRGPYPLGGRGHIDVIDFVFAPEAFDDGVDDRRTGADGARLARALDAERIGLARNVMRFEYE